MNLRDCDYKVYQITYQFDQVVRKSTCGGMDSEYSHTNKDAVGSALVVAPSEGLAVALFNHHRPSGHFSLCKRITNIMKIGDVDYMMKG